MFKHVYATLINQVTALCCFSHQATLCSMKGCMRAMVAQLKSDSEDLQQVNCVQLVKDHEQMLSSASKL